MAKNKNKSTITSFEGKKVKPNDKIKVVVTNSKFHDAGTVITVHPMQAEKLIADGKAEAYKSDEHAEGIAKKSAGKTPGKKSADDNGGGKTEIPTL